MAKKITEEQMLKKKAQSKIWYQKHKQLTIDRSSQWRLNNPEKYKEHSTKSVKKYQANNKSKIAKQHNIYRREEYQKMRTLVFNAYGNKCACCEQTIKEFLCIDHINNNGSKHRKEIANNFRTIYEWAIKNNYPSSLQILCYNCNQSKGYYGCCPHTKVNSCPEPEKYIDKSLLTRNQQIALSNNIRSKKYRRQCIEHYGNRCVCCNESIFEFLAIDHIHGGGNQHRKAVKKLGKYPTFNHYIVLNNFPEGYRILCHNCNSSYGYYGYCPHQTENSINQSLS